MSLVVVGSVAIDNVETPTEKRENLLGGSATHFSVAASFFTKVHLVGVVGSDWPAEHTEMMQSKGIDTAGLQVDESGETFTWTGRYHDNMNDRDTLDVQLNVFGEFQPKLPADYQEAKYVFLANGVPAVQMQVLDQTPQRQLCVADTMDLWITTQGDDLDKLMTQLDGLVLNDSEAKLLTDQENLVAAGRAVLKMGPKFVIIKKGEHGAMYFDANETFALPAYPTEQVIDPTGAGDSFAGGMMGYLAEQDKSDAATLKAAIAYGTVTASFNVEGFGMERMHEITRDDIDKRLEEYRKMLAC